MKRFKRSTCFVLALVMLLLTLPLQAFAVTCPSTIKEGDYYIVCAKNNNYALDVTGGGNAKEKTYIQLYQKNYTDAQVFTIKKVKSSPYPQYLIIHKRTGYVMNIKDGYQQKGARLWLYHNDGTASCHFYFTNMGNNQYAIHSVWKAVGTYVDAANGSMKNGTKIQMWSYNGNSNQRWQLVPVR